MDIGEVRPETETRLLAAFRERVSATAADQGRQKSTKETPGGISLAQRVSRFRSFVGMLRHPLPSYATILLLFAAITTGFWMGRSDRSESSPQGSYEPIRPAIRQPIQGTDAPEDALAVMQIPAEDSLTSSSGGLRRGPTAIRFMTTPSDAIGMIGGSLRDTL